MSITSVHVEVFPAIVLLATTRKEYRKLLKKHHGDPDIPLDNADGISSDHDHGYYLVGVFDGGAGTLVHELAHTAFKILRDVGVPVDHKGQTEAFCYLQQHLFEKLADSL